LAIQRLLDKGVIRLAGEFPKQKLALAAFSFTPLGLLVREHVVSSLPKFAA